MDKWIVISTTATNSMPHYYSGAINTYGDHWNTSDLMASLFPTEQAAVNIAVQSDAMLIIRIKKVRVTV